MPQPRLVLPRDRRSVSRWWRFVRAVFRDTSALLREFRRPIMLFLLATVGGGVLYGELLVRSGYPAIPLIDLPYIMLSLMVLQPPGAPPPEPHLIAFWYAMPVVAAIVIGRGAMDFARLFFNRNERRNAWEEAVASTYHNHVIILGIGHLGLRVARAVVEMGFEVVAIDNKITAERDLELNQMGVPLIAADGRLASTLETAGLRSAQALIVCTSNDYMNLEVTMRARDLNPTIRIVVRVWDDAFAVQIRRFMNVEAVMSASDLAAPAFAGTAVGIEIAQTLRVNGTEYSMIRLQVAAGSFMDGPTVGQLQDDYNMDIVLHGCNGEVIVKPPLENKVCAGDTLVIFAQHNRIIDVVSRNRHR